MDGETNGDRQRERQAERETGRERERERKRESEVEIHEDSKKKVLKLKTYLAPLLYERLGVIEPNSKRVHVPAHQIQSRGPFEA